MIECIKCGWYGDPSELVCSDEEANSNKPASQCTFNRCPQCGETEMEDLEDEE